MGKRDYPIRQRFWDLSARQDLAARLEIARQGEGQGESCGHPGCISHISHPCEKCGRKGGFDLDETDIARERLIGVMGNDRTFDKYIRERLAGDFAVALMAKLKGTADGT